MFTVKKLVIGAISAMFAFALAIPESAYAVVSLSNAELHFTTGGALRNPPTVVLGIPLGSDLRFQNPTTITVARGARVGVRAFITLNSSGSASQMSCVQLDIMQGGAVLFSTANNTFTERRNPGTYTVDFNYDALPAWSAANANAATLLGRNAGQRLKAPTAPGNYDVRITLYGARAGSGSNAATCNGDGTNATDFGSRIFTNAITVTDTPITTTTGANSTPVSMAVDPVFIGFRYNPGTLADGTLIGGIFNYDMNEEQNLPPSSGEHEPGYYFPHLMNINQYAPVKVFRGGFIGYEIAALHSKTWSYNQNAATGNPNGLAWTCTEAEILSNATGGAPIPNSRVYNNHDQFINGYQNFFTNSSPSISGGRVTNGGTNNRAMWVPTTGLTPGSTYAIRFRFYDTNNNSTGLNTTTDQPLVSGDRRCQGRVISEFTVPNAILIISDKVKEVSSEYGVIELNYAPPLADTWWWSPKTASIAAGRPMQMRVSGRVDPSVLSDKNWGCTQGRVLGTNINIHWNNSTDLDPLGVLSNWTTGRHTTESGAFDAPTEYRTYDVQYTFYDGDLSGGTCRGAIVGEYTERDAFRVEYIADIGVGNWNRQYREAIFGDFAVIGHGALCIPYGGPALLDRHHRTQERVDGDRGNNSDTAITDCQPGQMVTNRENMSQKFAYIPENFRNKEAVANYNTVNRSVRAHPKKSRTAAKLDIPKDAVIRHAKLYWIGSLVYRDKFGKDASLTILGAQTAVDTEGSLAKNALLTNDRECEKIFAGSPTGARTGRGALELAKNIKLELKDQDPMSLYADRIYVTGYDDNCHYLAQKDVTDLFEGQTGEEANGYYFVSDLVTRRSGDLYGTTGGWSLVLVWERKHDADQPPRVITYWDMLDGGSDNMATTISGFITPRQGDVNTTIFVMAADGDSEENDRICLTTSLAQRCNTATDNNVNRPHDGGQGRPSVTPGVSLYPYANGSKARCRITSLIPLRYEWSEHHCGKLDLVSIVFNPQFSQMVDLFQTFAMEGPNNAFANSVTAGPIGNGKRPAGQLPHFPLSSKWGGFWGAISAGLLGDDYISYGSNSADLKWDADDPQANYNLGFDLHTYYLSNYIGHGVTNASVRVQPGGILGIGGDRVELGVLGFSTMIFSPDFRRNFEKNSTIEYSGAASTCNEGETSVEDSNISYTVRFRNSGKADATEAIIYDDFLENGIARYIDLEEVINNRALYPISVYKLATTGTAHDPQDVTSKVSCGIDYETDGERITASKIWCQFSEPIKVGDAYEMNFKVHIHNNIIIYQDVPLKNEATITYKNPDLLDLAIVEKASSEVLIKGLVCGSENCRYLQNTKGVTQDGYYLIKPNTKGRMLPFEIYCEDMNKPYVAGDPASGPKDYLPLPFQSDFSNFVFTGLTGDKPKLPAGTFYSYGHGSGNVIGGASAGKRAIPMLPLIVPDESIGKDEAASSYTVNMQGKYIDKGFSSLNLQGTPFKVDMSQSSFGDYCVGVRTPYTQKTSGLIVGMNDQMFKINTESPVGYSAICNPEKIVIRQLDGYFFVDEGEQNRNNIARGGGPRLEAEDNKGDEQNDGTFGDNIINPARYAFQSCRQIKAKYFPAKAQVMFDGYYYVSPHKKTINRPYVVYCAPNSIGGEMTAFIALDANESFNADDVKYSDYNLNRDSCSKLGLMFFTPVTYEIMQDVRGLLKERKHWWEQFVGTLDDQNLIFHPGRGNEYFLQPEGRIRNYWPFGPMGIYAGADAMENGKLKYIEECEKPSGVRTRSTCDTPLYSKEYSAGGKRPRPNASALWSLGHRGFRSIFADRQIREFQFDEDKKAGDDLGEIVTWWWISDQSCANRRRTEGGRTYVVRPTRVPWSLNANGNPVAPPPSGVSYMNPSYWININDPETVVDTDTAEPNGDYECPGDWLYYVADNDGNIYHCNDAPFNSLDPSRAGGDSSCRRPNRVTSGYSYVHYTCLSEDSYSSMSFSGSNQYGALAAWDANPFARNIADAGGRLDSAARLYTKEESQPFSIEVGDPNMQNMIKSKICARAVEIADGITTPLTDWATTIVTDPETAIGGNTTDMNYAVITFETNTTSGSKSLPTKVSRNAAIQMQYISAKEANVNGDSLAEYDAAGYVCGVQSEEIAWSAFTNLEGADVAISSDNFAIRPVRYTATNLAFESPALRSGVEYSVNASASSGSSSQYPGKTPSIETRPGDGYTRTADDLTPADKRPYYFVPLAKELCPNPDPSDGWCGQPTKEGPVFKVSFVDGIGDVNTSYDDVGRFYATVVDESWTQVDWEVVGEPDCLMPDTGATNRRGTQFFNTFDKDDKGERIFNDRTTDASDEQMSRAYKIGCYVSGGAVAKDGDDEFYIGAVEGELTFIPFEFQITPGKLTSDYVVSGAGYPWAYLSSDSNTSSIKIHYKVTAVNYGGRPTKNYSDGNYSQSSDDNESLYGMYPLGAQPGNYVTPEQLAFAQNPLNQVYEPKRIARELWRYGEANMSDESVVDNTGPASWNFVRDLNAPMLPLTFKTNDFNITVVESTSDWQTPIVGSVLWHVPGTETQATFVYGRAITPEVTSYTEEANLTCVLDYFQPSDFSKERTLNAGFEKPLPSLNGESGWARIYSNTETTAVVPVDAVTDVNISVQTSWVKDNTEYKVNFGSSAFAQPPMMKENWKLSDSKPYQSVLYDHFDEGDRPRSFVTHLSIPPHLWYKPGGKPYVSIEYAVGGAINELPLSRTCVEHPCGKVNFLEPASKKWIGTGETEGRHFKDDANESLAPQRIWW
ncbi:MAG: hypothetical protein LBU73_03685 [Helicobacteraceae bacterium]|jgi:hypothetical protein|nr:hypothetical protein [Helicobacteraceae bacterium]